MKKWLSAIFLFFYCLLAFAQTGKELFDNSLVHEIRLEFDQPDFWNDLKTNYDEAQQFSGGDIEDMMARISIDGTLMDSIGVRLKGKSSYFYVDKKKPFKIDLNIFVEQSFDGLKKINLHNGIGDPAMLRDYLGYNLMRANGVMAPRVSFCRLFLNDEYWGLYEIVEQVDKTFLKNNFASGKGNLYKNQRWSNLDWWGDNPEIYKDTFELKTNEVEDDWSGLIRFLDVLNNSSDTDFPWAIEEVFNVDQYLHVLAIDVMTNNWDSYIDNRRNWYLYEEPKSGKIHWIPWDYNLSFGGRLITDGNPYPPYDEDCLIKTTFTYTQIGHSLEFKELSEPAAEKWYWDFGDGNFSDDQHPTHTFSSSVGKVEVCLTSSRLENGEECQQTRCVPIDLSDDPATCVTMLNGMVPYEASDPIYQQVIAEDEYCCSDQWDVFCTLKYLELEEDGPINSIETGFNYQVDYDLIQDDPEKILIKRLMEVPTYKERYLDICCIIQDQYFTKEKLFPQIDYFANLIREAIYEDPNYIYTRDYFEYAVGNGTGGGKEAGIPPLKLFFDQRFDQIDEDLLEANHDCEEAFSTLQWRDISINELVVSNTDGHLDTNGDADDWIELFNNTDQEVDLSGYYLKDNIAFPNRWFFPKGTKIAANDYLIIWADKDLDQDGLHANFKLKMEGEELLLAHEDGTWIDYVSFSTQVRNTAYARIPNGTGEFVFQSPTHKYNNENTTNVLDLEEAINIDVSPNPWNKYIELFFDQALNQQEVKVSLLNILGQVVQSQIVVNENSIRLEISEENIPQGIYFINVEYQNKKHIFKTIKN